MKKLGKLDKLILFKIGLAKIESATIFVDWLATEFHLSVSNLWLRLNTLKKHHILRFSKREKLALTERGVSIFRYEYRTMVSLS